jgi:hypothetical protein
MRQSPMADAEVNLCEAQCQEKIVNTNVYKNWYALFLNAINAAYTAFGAPGYCFVYR